MATHGMIDLETLSTRPDATILTVGAIKFDPYTNEEPHSGLYLRLNVDEQSELDRHVDDNTLEWWSKQNKKVRDEAFDQKGSISVNETLKQINKWMVGVDVLWGQGYGFDMTILENMYRSVGVPIPWNFWQVRDSRTLFKCCKEDPRKSMQTDLHNALADAYFQAKSIQVAYKELGVKQ